MLTWRDSAISQGTKVHQQFRVAMPEPTNHLFEVTLDMTEVAVGSPLLLKMPVWTPGSYLVREYARHLQDFQAWDPRQECPLPWRKINKHTWQIETDALESGDPLKKIGGWLRVSYRVYAYELSVRTNHLEGTHGYFNGAALFLYTPAGLNHPYTLTIQPPYPDWQIATSLLKLSNSDETETFWAANYDELVDSPVEVGQHQRIDFQVLGKPHQWVVWGSGNLDSQQAVADTEKIITTTAALFDGLPYSHYLFLIHLSADGFGGLEHKNATTLNFSRLNFHDQDRYQRFLALVAHEFFHAWNVKRLRPVALETFDYEQENYVQSLWFCEGATSYYENLILLRSGLITFSKFLSLFSEAITRLQKLPGRHIQSLSESSFDTWIKLYRPHENTPNSQVSYYLKGSIVCALLDLHIRYLSQGSRSFDQVFQLLWQQFGRIEKGYTDQQLQQIFEQVAQSSLQDFFADYIYGTRELDYDHYLDPFGLRLVGKYSQNPPLPYLGLHLASDGSNKISHVDMGSPAQQAGIWAGDELLALNGFKVNPSHWLERLKDCAPQQAVSLSIFQQQELKTVWLPLGLPRADLYEIEDLPEISPEQAQLRQGWLGDPSTLLTL
ncbi:MAG: PDZ domain-containing protein [Cyanobacteriota bacterium]|nr:PDZ domain-containing protein [Cyanobacteriota bacterium]